MIDPSYLEILQEIGKTGKAKPKAMLVFNRIASDKELYIPFLKNDGVTPFLDAVKALSPNTFYAFLGKPDVLFTIYHAGQTEWCRKAVRDIPDDLRPKVQLDNWAIRELT